MDSPSLYLTSLLLVLLFFTACTGERSPVPISTVPSENVKSTYYYETARVVKDTRKKITYLDSALSSIEDPRDTLLPVLLDNKIYYHNTLKEYDSSLFFTDSLISASRFQQDTSMLAMGYYRRSRINFYLDNHEEVFRNAFESARLYLAIGDSTRAGRRSMEMANAQHRVGDFSGSQEVATNSLRLLKPKTASDSVYLSSVYNTIAISYRDMELYEDAAAEYENALRFSPSRSDSLKYLNNLALVFRDQGNYNAAIKILEDLVEKVDRENEIGVARFNDNLAYIKWKRDPEVTVVDDLLKALELRIQNNDQEGLLASYSHLSDYFQNKDKSRSAEYAEALLETARSYGFKPSELEALERLVELSSGDAMREYSLRYIALNDSITTANVKAQNSFAKIKYDEERKQQEIVNLETQNALQTLEAQRLRIRGFSAGLAALLLLVTLFFIVYYLRQRHRREKIREVHKTESRISKVIHDELANDIFNVMTSLELTAPTPVVDKLEKIYLRTRDISRENSDIDTGENYIAYLKATLANTTPDNARLIVSGENNVNWAKIVDEKKIVVYRVLQELMINMKKHSRAGLVAISFSRNKNFLEINYSDNGSGLSGEAIRKGSGLRNVENRIFSLNGRITFETEEGKGFKVWIQIPL